MKAADFDDFFTGCCTEVLDAMFFTTVLDATRTDALGAMKSGGYAFALRFTGDISGQFGLHLDYSTAYSLASSFLGEDGGELPHREVGDVVGELANMLCGAVMSQVQSRHKFVLSHPEPLAETPDLKARDVLISRLETDTGTITTWVALDRAERIA